MNQAARRYWHWSPSSKRWVNNTFTPDHGDLVIWDSPTGFIWAEYDDGCVGCSWYCWILYKNLETGEIIRAMAEKAQLLKTWPEEDYPDDDELDFAPPGYPEEVVLPHLYV